MSLPPKYQRQIDDEESVPLYKGEEPRHSLDGESGIYPPRFGQASAGNDDGPINVKYTFVPRWPVVGEEQNALGVLGRTKAVSFMPYDHDIVARRYFSIQSYWKRGLMR